MTAVATISNEVAKEALNRLRAIRRGLADKSKPKTTVIGSLLDGPAARTA